MRYTAIYSDGTPVITFWVIVCLNLYIPQLNVGVFSPVAFVDNCFSLCGSNQTFDHHLIASQILTVLKD